MTLEDTLVKYQVSAALHRESDPVAASACAFVEMFVQSAIAVPNMTLLEFVDVLKQVVDEQVEQSNARA